MPGERLPRHFRPGFSVMHPCANCQWRSAQPGRSAKTVRKNKHVLEPVLTAIATIRLRELTTADVCWRTWLP